MKKNEKLPIQVLASPKRGPSNLILLLAAIVFLILLAFALFRFTSPQHNNTFEHISYPDNSRKVNFTITDLKKSTQLLSKSIPYDRLEAEAINLKVDNQQTAVNIYKSQTLKDGWIFSGQDSWFYFRKDSKGIAIAPIFVDEGVYDYLIRTYPVLKDQIEIGTVFVTLVYGSYEDTRLLGDG